MAWSLGDIDGLPEVRIPLLEDDVLQGTLVITIDARDLQVVYEAEPDSAPLAGFSAWSKGS